MDVEVAPGARRSTATRPATVVVGSGIAGISTAYELAREGQKVIVVDRGRIAGGMTARTIGASCAAVRRSDVGNDQAARRRLSRAFYESQAAAVDRIEDIQKKKASIAISAGSTAILFQALGYRLEDHRRGTRSGAQGRRAGSPASSAFPCRMRRQHVLRYPRQATFHPLKYLAGVAKASTRTVACFFADTVVTVIEENRTARFVVKTDRGNIRRGAAVVATNSPIIDRSRCTPRWRRIGPMRWRSKSRAARCPMRSIGTRSIPITMSGCSQATARIDYLIVGGEDHKSGEADDADCPLRGAGSMGAQSDSAARRRSPIAGPDRCSIRSTMPASSAAIPAATASTCTPAIPDRA